MSVSYYTGSRTINKPLSDMNKGELVMSLVWNFDPHDDGVETMPIHSAEEDAFCVVGDGGTQEYTTNQLLELVELSQRLRIYYGIRLAGPGRMLFIVGLTHDSKWSVQSPDYDFWEFFDSLKAAYTRIVEIFK